MSKTIRIFVSSPGDVNDEREKARQVIDNLQRHYPGALLQPVLWQDLALPLTASFQESIDFILQKEPIDIAVFILWSRLGSPLGPSICRPDGTAYRSGTEREFELMLEAYRQSGQQRPVMLAYVRRDEGSFQQTLQGCSVSEIEEVISQRKLADSFIREQFTDAEGHNVRAYHSYREPVSFAQRLHTHLRHILDESLIGDATPRWTGEPYRGLEVFNIEHAPIFQGRDEETCDILQRLRDQEEAGCAFVAIVGASGSGKSSLARAGVAAVLAQHAYDDRVEAWRIVPFFPGLGGHELCRSLAQSLFEQLPELRAKSLSAEDIASGLSKDPSLTVRLSLIPALNQAETSSKGAIRILLLVDQLEELWTDRRITAEDRLQFFQILEALARSGHVAILATLRTDFYPHAQSIPGFLRLKGERGHFDLLPPGPAALHRLITEPARLAGLKFERDEQSGRGLDELLLQDATRDPASLPLLQYTLSELYNHRDSNARLLTLAAYDALGGVEGAIGKRATETFQSLSQPARAALSEISPLLVTVDTAGEQSAVRRRAPLDELRSTPAREELTDQLIAARFLATDRQGDFLYASLAHEALLRRWKHLAQWVSANRDHLRMRATVEQSHERWQQRKQDPSLLLSPGLPLEEGRQLLQKASAILTNPTRDYIRTSISHQEAQARRRRDLRRLTFAAMSALLILALGGGLFAWQQWSVSRGVNSELLKKNVELENAKDSLTNTNTNLESTQQNLKKALERADFEKRMARREQIRQFTTRAWKRSDEDDPAGCFTLLGQALRLAEGDPEEEPLARIRFNQMWRRFPILGFWNNAQTAAFSPNGQEVAIGEITGQVSIWRSDDFRLQKAIETLPFTIIHLSYNASGSQLAIAGMGGNVTVWNRELGETIRNLRIPAANWESSTIQQAWFTGDGGLIGATSKGVLFQFSATSDEPVRIPDDVGEFQNFSDDRTLVLTRIDENFVQVFETGSWRKVGKPLAHPLAYSPAKLSPDGKLVATIEKKKTVISTVDGAVLGRVPNQRSVTFLNFSPDSRRLVTISSPFAAPLPGASSPSSDERDFPDPDVPYEICVIEPGRPPGVVRIPTKDSILSAVFSPDGRDVLTTGYRYRDPASGQDDLVEHKPLLRILDAVTGQSKSESVPMLSDRTQAFFGPNNRLLIATAGKFRSCTTWDYQQLTSVTSTTLPTANLNQKGSGFEPDNKTYAVWSEDAYLRWRLDSGKVDRLPPEPIEATQITTYNLVLEMRAAPQDFVDVSGSMLTATTNYTVAVPVQLGLEITAVRGLLDRQKARAESHAPSAEDIQRLNVPGNNQFHGFLRSAFVLITNRADIKSARVWDIDTNSAATSLLTGPLPVFRGTFSPDGRYVAVVFREQVPFPVVAPLPPSEPGGPADNPDSRQMIRIWDVRNGQPLTPLLKLPALYETFSDDSQYFVAVGSDEIRLVDLTHKLSYPVSTPAISLTQAVSQRTIDTAGELTEWDVENLEADLAAARDLKIQGTEDQQLSQRREEALWCADRASSRRSPRLRILAGKHARIWARQEPTQVDAWLTSADAYSQEQQYALALPDLDKAMEVDPTEIDSWLHAGLLHLHQKNTTRYVELCQQALARFRKDNDVHLIDELVWLHVLAPGPQIDATELNRLANWICKQHPNERVHQNTKFAVLYRTRSPKEAMEWSQACSGNFNTPGHNVATDILTQMANFRMAENDEQKATVKRNLADAAARLKVTGKAAESISWVERVEMEILLREARELTGDFGPGSRINTFPMPAEAMPAPAPPGLG